MHALCALYCHDLVPFLLWLSVDFVVYLSPAIDVCAMYMYHGVMIE